MRLFPRSLRLFAIGLLLPAATFAQHVATPSAAAVAAVPASAARAALSPARDPVTGIFGVDPLQARAIVATLKAHYGDELIDVAVIGSRARGEASAMKGRRPVRAASDLDLVPVLRRDLMGRGPDPRDIGRILAKLLGYSVEVHTVIAYDGRRGEDAVPFYGGGEETWHSFRDGAAVRIPLEP